MVHKVIALSVEIKDFLTDQKLCPQESYDHVLRRMRSRLEKLSGGGG